MKKTLIFLPLLSFAIYSCEVEKTEKGEAPELDVNVDAEAGEMPEYDVDWANVDVSTTTKTVEVPKVIVTMEKEQVEVPSIDVNFPDDDRERMRQTIMVEAEITGQMKDLDITKVYAIDDNLYVIAELREGNQTLNNETVRVSDQIEINAPDLDVRYYIIGSRPEGAYNEKYRYISSENEISGNLTDAKLIYEG